MLSKRLSLVLVLALTACRGSRASEPARSHDAASVPFVFVGDHAIRGAFWTPSGHLVTHSDTDLFVLDPAAAGQMRRIPLGARARVVLAADEGARFAIVFEDHADVWDAATVTKAHTVAGHFEDNDYGEGVISHDASRVAWRQGTCPPAEGSGARPSAVRGHAPSTPSTPCGFLLYDLDTLKPVATVGDVDARDVFFSEDSRFLVVTRLSAEDSTFVVAVYDAGTGKHLFERKTRASMLGESPLLGWSDVFRFDGDLLVLSRGKLVETIDVRTGKTIAKHLYDDRSTHALAKAGSRVATVAQQKRQIVVWDYRRNQVLRTFDLSKRIPRGEAESCFACNARFEVGSLDRLSFSRGGHDALSLDVATGQVTEVQSIPPTDDDEDLDAAITRATRSPAVSPVWPSRECTLASRGAGMAPQSIPSIYCFWGRAALRRDGAYLESTGRGVLGIYDVHLRTTVLTLGAVPTNGGATRTFEIAHESAMKWLYPRLGQAAEIEVPASTLDRWMVAGRPIAEAPPWLLFDGTHVAITPNQPPARHALVNADASSKTELKSPTCEAPVALAMTSSGEPLVLCLNEQRHLTAVDAHGAVLWERAVEHASRARPWPELATRDARVLLRSGDSALVDTQYVVDIAHRSVTELVVAADYAIAHFDDDRVELFGDVSGAAKSVRCLSGNELLPFDSCRRRYEVAGRLVPLAR